MASVEPPTAGARQPDREARSRILNCLPSPEQGSDWQLGAALAASSQLTAPIPRQLDLRKPWWPVGDQGATGSCVGWATADSVLRWHFVQTGLLAKHEQLSVRYLWMASKETDEFVSRPSTFIENDGTSLKAALDVARKFGVVLESELPFLLSVFSHHDSNTFYGLAAQRKIASYINLGRDLSAWRRWIALQGPILVRMDVDAEWDRAAWNGGRLETYRPATVRGGHAVSIVGYTPSHFIVRNSWGTGWGDGGFAYAADAYAAHAFTEAYGITV
jgi:C1A family cysteine protease